MARRPIQAADIVTDDATGALLVKPVAVEPPGAASQAGASVTVSNANAKIIDANPNRKKVVIQNNDPVRRITLRFAATAAVAGKGLVLEPGFAWEEKLYVGQINGIADGPAGFVDNVSVVEI